MMSDDILIFRTSVVTKEDVERIGILFAQNSCIHKWSIDLEDWEKVLRIESRGITADRIIKQLHTIDIFASELE